MELVPSQRHAVLHDRFNIAGSVEQTLAPRSGHKLGVDNRVDMRNRLHSV